MELALTDECPAWSFVGVSYRSMLLRADAGQRGRATVADPQRDRVTALADELRLDHVDIEIETPHRSIR